MREGTAVEKSNREKKSNSKCHTLPSISSRTSLSPSVEMEGAWRFTIPGLPCLADLALLTSQSSSPHAFLSSFLVG